MRLGDDLAPVARRGATLSSMDCMMAGTPAMTMTLPSMKPGALETAFSIRSAPCGNAGHAAARLVQVLGLDAFEQQRDGAGILGDADRRSALATLSAVMSSWVGPMPPVVNR